jgi:hypothetical protein
LRRLALPLNDLLARLLRRHAVPIGNLPEDAEVVAARADPARGVVLLTLRSQAFPRVAKGTPIPELAPAYRRQENAQVFMPRRWADKFLYSMRGASVPYGAAIVGCHWDEAREGAVWQIKTKGAEAAAEGGPLTEYAPY